MNEPIARRVLLVRAIEQGDPDGRILPQSERLEATREAMGDDAVPPPSPDQTAPMPLSAAQEAFVSRRSEGLLQRMVSKFPEAQTALDQVRWPGWIGPLLVTAALLAGLATNALGPERRINIIAFPLLGMLVWNFVVYALLLLRHRKREGSESGRFIIQMLSRAVLPREGRESGPSQADEAGLLRRRLVVFVNQWLQLGKPLHLARASRLLHLCASVLALGAVAGMYWRGLAFQFLAGWESTFLDAEAVRGLLGIVLGPASMVTGIELPSAEALREMVGLGSEGGPAAMWIHLYAATAGLFILLPRLGLAAASYVKERRLNAVFPMPDTADPYFRRLLSVRQGRGDHVRVVPCGFQLADRETLRGVLGEWLGLSVQVDFQDTVTYGMEDEYLGKVREADVCEYLIVMFNLAATPEEETHGSFIEGLKRMIREGHGGRRLLLLLEESAYRGRLKGQAGWEERLVERRKSWGRLAQGHGMELASLDLQHDLGNWASDHRHLLTTEGEA